MRDLAARLGLHLGSVYNALGDKERVFESSLKLNFEQYVRPRLKMLGENPDPMHALESYVSIVMEECTSPGQHPGCFMTNSLLEISHINDNITSTVRDYLNQIEDAFTQCIERAQKMNQVPSNKDARIYARFMTGLIFSIRTMAKLKMPVDSIMDIRNCGFKALAA